MSTLVAHPPTLGTPIYWIFVGHRRSVEQSEELLPLRRALVRSSGLGCMRCATGRRRRPEAAERNAVLRELSQLQQQPRGTGAMLYRRERLHPTGCVGGDSAQ